MKTYFYCIIGNKFEIVSNELATLLNINLKYLSTKKNTYANDISYFTIENLDVDTIVKDITEQLKIHYWKSKNKRTDNNVYRIRY